jgi:tetratricopeptide (TPR) repeat protein
LNRIYDLSEPERAAQVAAKAAAEASRRAAQAGEAEQRSGWRTSAVADASTDAAKAAADASREASRAAEAAARAANTPTLDAPALVRRETMRARDAAERAWEAADEAADRPAPVPPASTVQLTSTSSPGFFQGIGRSVQAEASFARGSALLEERKYQEARDRLAEAVALYPEHDQARALLAWSEYFLGDFRGAAVTFKTGLRRQPTWEGLYNGLGWSRLRLGRYQLAAAAFGSALDRNPDYVDALNGLGSAQFERGHYDLALPPLEKALQGSRRLLRAEPAEVTILRGKMAWSLYYLERHREALAMFIRASLAAPDSQQYQVGMGWCYLKLEQKDDARAAFRRAQQLGPTDETVREGLRRVGL